MTNSNPIGALEQEDLGARMYRAIIWRDTSVALLQNRILNLTKRLFEKPDADDTVHEGPVLWTPLMRSSSCTAQRLALRSLKLSSTVRGYWQNLRAVWLHKTTD